MKEIQTAFHPFGILRYNFRKKLDGKETHDESSCYMVYCDEDYVIVMTQDDYKCDFHLLHNEDIAFHPVHGNTILVKTIRSRVSREEGFNIEGIEVFLLLEVNCRVGVFRVGLMHDGDDIKLLHMPLIKES